MLALALGLRLVFAALTADSYDPDEFVVLALSKDYAHGAVPYRDFMFFHPPGVLVLFRLLQPLVTWWWPSGRMVVLLIDSGTAVLVWRIGSLLYGRREGLVAGLVYGTSPIAILGAVRIGQDPLITALGVAGLLLLLSLRSSVGGVLAGVCLGLAIWFKYPALIFLPVYLLIAPRRAPLIVAAIVATDAVAFAPYIHNMHALYNQSVGWQVVRTSAPLVQRVPAVLVFWLLLNPWAAEAAIRVRTPRWVLVGFASGGLFVLASQVYYHYFIPVVPFAALLAAPWLARTIRRSGRRVLLTGMTVLALWSVALNSAPTMSGLGMLRLSAVDGTVHLLELATGRSQGVLADHFEYAYLAGRSSVTDYFWNLSHMVGARTLERRLPATAAVVSDSPSSYPPGFVGYLERRRYAEVRRGAITIWLMRRTSPDG